MAARIGKRHRIRLQEIDNSCRTIIASGASVRRYTLRDERR
jgi:hypothetical protein